jgi:hypothetical protein
MDNVLNRYNANGIPPHELQLKVNDVCIVTRPILPYGLATNSRVRIIDIHTYHIRVQTMDKKQTVANIPRMKFIFKLDYGRSFHLMRTQFPLRLAYSVTYNKSQSQSYACNVLIDTTSQPFAHGHLYVALSRTRNCDNVALYTSEQTLHPNPFVFEHGKFDDTQSMPVVTNIVINKVLSI